MSDSIVPPPPPEPGVEGQLEIWCAAVRRTILAYANSAQGLREWTPKQRTRLQATFHGFTKDRSVRLAMGNRIVHSSGLTGKRLITFNELSEAQASGLLTAFYGPGEDSTMLLPIAQTRLTQLRDLVEWEQYQDVLES